MRAGLTARMRPPAFTLTYTGDAAAAAAARSATATTTPGLKRAPAFVLPRVEWENRLHTRRDPTPGPASPPSRRLPARAVDASRATQILLWRRRASSQACWRSQFLYSSVKYNRRIFLNSVDEY